MRRALELARLAVTTEVRMYVAAARLLARRPDVPDGATPVRYAGAVAALLWGITIVSVVELVALHLILPWEVVRVVADVVGIWGAVWCLGLTAAHYVYPHLATDDALVLRAQRRSPAVTIAWDLVVSAGVRERSLESSRAVQVDVEIGAGPGVVSLVVGQRTNVDLRLRRPVAVEVRGVTHEVDEVRVYVDDPRELVALARPTPTGGGKNVD